MDLRVEKGSRPSVRVDGEGRYSSGSGDGDWAVIGPDDTFDQMLDKLGLAEDISRDASARADGAGDSDDPEKLLRRKCLDGFFKHGCPQCTGSRGHRRLHRKLKNQPVSEGTLNIDVSGPHGESIDKQRYFLAAVLLMPDGTCIPFAKCMETKTANETRKKLTEVLAQVVAMSDGQIPLLRVHSDCGGEFTADSMCAYFRRMGLWKTKSVPYCKQSSGKVERAIQTIKHQSTSLLLHGGLPAIFWTFAVQHAVYVLRAAALEIPCPKDAPIFGSLVAVKKPHSDAFESRVEQGIYLGADDSFVDGANVLVQRDGEGGMKIIKSRLPVLLNVSKPTWKKSLSPDEEHEVWISSDGEVRWTAPNGGEITTFEERTDGPQYDDPARYRNLEQAIKRKLHGAHDEIADLPDLVRFNHGFLVAEPSCLKAKVEADSRASDAEAEGKYVVLGAEYEEAQIRQEMETLLSGAERASARTVDNQVFFEGSEQQKAAWYAAIDKELRTMGDKGVWDETTVDRLKEQLGYVPDLLPAKTVNVEKPALDAEPGTVEHELGYKPRSRIVVCGNFQNTEGSCKEDFASVNVDPEAVRYMLALLAEHRDWTALSWDVACAFLNAYLSEKHRAVVRPPKVLERLGLVKPGTVWHLKRALYGLRVSPMEWQQERDKAAAMTEMKLDPQAGDLLGKLTLREISTSKGLWAIIDEQGRTVGVGTFYVDDGLAVGLPEAIARVCHAISQLWEIKVQGILRRCGVTEGDTFKRHGISCPVVSEFSFLGTQIVNHPDGILLTQRRWLLQELATRGWANVHGSHSLPVPQEGTLEPEERDYSFAERLKHVQSELGSLMWLGLRSRPDICSTIGVTACLAATNPREAQRLCTGLWRYLRGTVDWGILYTASGTTTLDIHTDASFSPGGSKSRSGIVLKVGNNIISWKSLRQALTAFSATESELEGMTLGVELAVKLRVMMQEINNTEVSCVLHADNTGAINLATRDQMVWTRMRTRHYALRTSWLRDQLIEEGIPVEHCRTSELAADGLTKVLSKGKLALARGMLSMIKWKA